MIFFLFLFFIFSFFFNILFSFFSFRISAAGSSGYSLVLNEFDKKLIYNLIFVYLINEIKK